MTVSTRLRRSASEAQRRRGDDLDARSASLAPAAAGAVEAAADDVQGVLGPHASPPPQDDDMYEQLAAEFLTEQGEAAYRDNCDQLDRFSDAALADQLVTTWVGPIGKLDSSAWSARSGGCAVSQ